MESFSCIIFWSMLLILWLLLYIRQAYIWNFGYSRTSGEPWKEYRHAYTMGERYYCDSRDNIIEVDAPFLEQIFKKK